MSMYRCAVCDKVKDSDYEVCHEYTYDNTKLMCDDCAGDIELNESRFNNIFVDRAIKR